MLHDDKLVGVDVALREFHPEHAPRYRAAVHGHRRALVDYFVYSRDVAGVSERLDALSEAHWSYMDRFADHLVARGPTLTADGETHTGSMHIVTVQNAGAARHFVEDEPFHSAGLYADTALSRYVDLLERSMWDRPRAPDLEQTTFLRAAWPAIPADERTVRAARETAVAGSDPWVFLGLLVSNDASRCVGIAAAADLTAGPAELALRPVLASLRQVDAPVETQRWQRGGRPRG
ncbi:MAG: YciI family protein [Kofleriaceae bacterium]